MVSSSCDVDRLKRKLTPPVAILVRDYPK